MAPEARDARINALLSEWETRRAQGEAPRPELLCRACPELLPELRRQLSLLESAKHPLGESTVNQPRRAGDVSTTESFVPGEPGDFDFLAPSQAEDELGRLGNYRILKLLGKGGMGMVLLAHDPALDRKVALKVMLPRIAAKPEARQRFLREAQLAAKLHNDHIVTIHQVGEDRGVPFLAMELLAGKPLDALLQPGAGLPPQQILRIGREIAQGLAAAHDQGLLHRDIKPANIWLETRDGDVTYRVKVLDFGLARWVADEEHLTQSGAIVGTPAYMAPEQARGDRIDARADLFSLGCVLYRLCVGENAFRGETAIAILSALANHEPPAPRELRPQIPAPLSDLVMRLLAKDPSQRPHAARDVVADITAIEGGAAPRVRKSRRLTARYDPL